MRDPKVGQQVWVRGTIKSVASVYPAVQIHDGICGLDNVTIRCHQEVLEPRKHSVPPSKKKKRYGDVG